MTAEIILSCYEPTFLSKRLDRNCRSAPHLLKYGVLPCLSLYPVEFICPIVVIPHPEIMLILSFFATGSNPNPRPLILEHTDIEPSEILQLAFHLHSFLLACPPIYRPWQSNLGIPQPRPVCFYNDKQRTIHDVCHLSIPLHTNLHCDISWFPFLAVGLRSTHQCILARRVLAAIVVENCTFAMQTVPGTLAIDISEVSESGIFGMIYELEG